MTDKYLKEILINKFEDGEVEIYNDDKSFVIKIENKDRFYRITDNKNVEGPIEVFFDDFPGDITKGGTATGTESNPYIINCIEDLVAVSIASNGGNNDLRIEMKNGNIKNGISYTNYYGKYIILNRTLDFENDLSYTNSKRTDFGDLNQDGIIEDIKTELTSRNGRGFIPIKLFDTVFDGKENEIRNIYENSTMLDVSTYVGLCGDVAKSEVKNIGVSGELTGNWFAAGIVANAYGGTLIKNCQNKSNIIGNTMVGGIAGYHLGANGIEECENFGNIEIKGRSWGYGGAGGIVANGGKHRRFYKEM